MLKSTGMTLRYDMTIKTYIYIHFHLCILGQREREREGGRV